MNMQESALGLVGLQSLALTAWQRPDASFLEQLPVAMYACDAAGLILWFNTRAAELWGRFPSIGDDCELFCGSHKLYFDGHLITRDQTPMTEVLRSGVPIRGVEGRVERPDGSHVWAVVHIAPIKDEDGKVIIAVSDSGEGLDAANSEQLFDAFFTTKPDGMGMGLAISRTIVEAHGGRIWATANSPKGAVFQFTLSTGANGAR